MSLADPKMGSIFTLPEETPRESPHPGSYCPPLLLTTVGCDLGFTYLLFDGHRVFCQKDKPKMKTD